VIQDSALEALICRKTVLIFCCFSLNVHHRWLFLDESCSRDMSEKETYFELFHELED
jgi:hypothetical protein